MDRISQWEEEKENEEEYKRDVIIEDAQNELRIFDVFLSNVFEISLELDDALDGLVASQKKLEVFLEKAKEL